MSNPTLARYVEERERINANTTDILATVESEERDPSDAERELLTRNNERLGVVENFIGELLDIEERQAKARDARAVLSRNATTTTTVTTTTPPATEVVYRTFAQWARDELIARFDAIAVRSGTSRELARERLTRAVANTLTTDVPGLLPPQHMTEIIDVISTYRPIVQSARRTDLNNGKLTYPKITQRPTVEKQTAEKTETTSQKMTVAMQDVLADTYLGAGDLSWQTINWTVPNALQLWFQLAAEAYAQATEAAAADVLVAAATPNGTAVLTDDFAGWYSAIVTAAGAVFGRVRRPADTVWTDTATGFTLAGMVSNLTPVFNTQGNISATTGLGTLAGLRFVTSPALDAGQTVVGIGNMLLCAETPGAPVELRAVEPSIGGMEVGVIGAFACEAMEPLAFQLITPPVGGATTTATTTRQQPSGGK